MGVCRFDLPSICCKFHALKGRTVKKILAVVWVSTLMASSAWTQPVLKVAVNEASRQYQPALTALYKEVGLVPEFVVLPFERALKSVESGDVDADLGRVVGGTAGYRNMVELQESLTEISLLAVVRKESHLTRLSLPELKGHVVGTVRGGKMAEAMAAQQALKLVQVNTQQQLYQMLLNDRLEVALTTSVVLPGQDVAPLVKVLPPLSSTRAVHVLNQKWAAWAPKLDTALRAMKADGRWAKLITVP